MDKAIIGAVLKKRIKEQGYTQADFAEEVGIGLSSLKKYMNGENAYTYEIMELFANKLDCSYDYLLGLSKSPTREYHEIAEQTRLSEVAIKKIVKNAKYYDTELTAKSFIMTLDLLLCEDGALNSICDYLYASKPVNEILQGMISAAENVINNNPIIKKMGIEDDRKISMETQIMIDIIIRLKNLKQKITPEFIAELKQLDTFENYQKGLEKLTELSKSVVMLDREEYEELANR